MENFLSLLESIDPSWLTPSSTTRAMDMIFAFVCGLGLFRLLSPLLPPYSPSPPPAENTTPQKVVRREHRKVRKKTRTVKAYRVSGKKPKEDKVLGSLLHSIQERLGDTCKHLRQDASGEAFKRDDAKAHLPPRKTTGKSVETHSSLETSSAPSNEHLLLKDSKPLSPVLMTSSLIESQLSERVSWPPETLTTGRCHSPTQQAPSYPFHPQNPVACPPSLPYPNMAVREFNSKILGTLQSSQTLPCLPSPIPTTPGINHSRRPTSTTPGLNYSSRSTSTSLDLEHLSRPTSTTPGLDFSSRPTSTTSGLDTFSKPTSTNPGIEHSSRPTSGPIKHQITSSTLCHSTSSTDESLQEDLSLTIHKASFSTGPTDSQIEAREPSFISPVIHEMQEIQLSKRVQLKYWQEKGKGRSDLSSGSPGSMPHSCSSKGANITSRSFWNKDSKSDQLSGHQKDLDNDLKEKCVQLYWGLPWLHSESLVTPVIMTMSPLDSPSILFNGLSTYSPLHVKTKGHPQEVFNQQRFNSWGSQGQGPVVHLQGNYIIPELREQTEEDCKKRLSLHQGQRPPKVQLSLGLGQAEVNHRTLGPSAQKNESRECPHSVSLKGPEMLQPWRTPHKDLPNILGRALGKDLPPEGSLGRVLEALSETERETCHMRCQTSDTHTLNMRKDTTSPFPQSSNDSLSWDSTEDSMTQLAGDLGEPIQQAPERDMKTASSVECQSIQNCPALQPALLREAPPSYNSVPPEAPTTARGYNVTSVSTPESLMGRAWHRDTLVRSWAEYPEPNPGRVQKSEGGTLSHNDNEVSVREITGVSQSSRSRGTRKLEETEEEESHEWTLPVEAAKIADFQTNQFLGASGNLSKTFPQDADDLGLNTPHCSAAGVILQDCATGELCQNWDPEVVIAAEILASRTCRYRPKTEPTTAKSHCNYRSPF
uniref:spermatogenesis-associated protein 31A6-like n=1 Tax=Myodes glareolus TaxID=447135 RepID=UPI0020228025|nr:spermatogenesis-associated protein 31A6-like [Myodes glareolus]